MFYNFYEEIPDSPIGILRTPDLRLLSKDNDSMIPRPKLGWPIRKVTFGKWKISFQVELLLAMNPFILKLQVNSWFFVGADSNLSLSVPILDDFHYFWKSSYDSADTALNSANSIPNEKS